MSGAERLVELRVLRKENGDMQVESISSIDSFDAVPIY